MNILYLDTSTHGTPTVVFQPRQLRSFVRTNTMVRKIIVPHSHLLISCHSFKFWSIYIPVAESIEPKLCILENHVPSCSFTAILALDSGTNHCQPGTPVQAEAAPAKRTPDVLHFGYGACIDDEVNASLVVPRLETETNKLIILETNISPSKALFKIIFLFFHVGYVIVPRRVSLL